LLPVPPSSSWLLSDELLCSVVRSPMLCSSVQRLLRGSVQQVRLLHDLQHWLHDLQRRSSGIPGCPSATCGNQVAQCQQQTVRSPSRGLDRSTRIRKPFATLVRREGLFLLAPHSPQRSKRGFSGRTEKGFLLLCETVNLAESRFVNVDVLHRSSPCQKSAHPRSRTASGFCCALLWSDFWRSDSRRCSASRGGWMRNATPSPA
jgi:hypothetical protein